MKTYLVLDVGGSAIKYALMDEEAHFIEQSSIPTPKDSLEEFVDAICHLYEQYQDRVSGLAMSMPGIIDPKQGYCYTGGALLYIQDVNLVELLNKRIPCKITIGNDAKCAANAEVGFGNLKDVDDGVVIVLGTGIGGCLVKDRKVHYGKHFFGGEFSFVSTAGLKDEALWSRENGIRGLLTCVQNRLESNEHLTGIDIFERANNGDEKVCEGIKDFVRILMRQIYNLQAIFDPQRFVIGGGISAQPLLFDYINEVNDELFDSMYFAVKPEIKPCLYRNGANLIGALYQHLNG